MRLTKKIGIAIIIGLVVLAGLNVIERKSNSKVGVFTSTAQAKVGRPLTPVSVAGVARRTSRRN